MRAVTPHCNNNEEMRHENKIKNKNHKNDISRRVMMMVIIDDNNSNDGKFYNVIYVSCTQVMYDI
jgi:hypothetical protein